ncbi:hypothetical protein BCV70DRAFT_201738 [Testicularia cyperi]|uniref:Glucosidase 2 subunit beta n=1 Tax=Testicularia cyperi TaxID=1882483 RepID=A0A317XK43_9BASI|nr:hypothetical protein BCV70DRAFT_201738 [Testicularia cyperi]
MVRIGLAVAALAVTTSASASAAASAFGVESKLQQVRGVSPDDITKYQPYQNAAGQLRWKCLDGSHDLAWTAVNDDYCDCPDGSDEPGTSACPNSTFYCHNKGHIPTVIRSSRVDDGICDPECCDGSDETDGKVSCPNRCEKIGREYRKKMTELENIRRAGGKIRDRYITEARKDKEALEAEIAQLEVQVQVAIEREQRLKQDLQRAETVDRAVIDAKMRTPLYAKLTAHQAAVKSLAAAHTALKTELQTLTLLLDDLAKGYNPNYQDMAVKGAVVAYKEWRGVPADTSADELASDNAKLKTLFDQGEWGPQRLDELVREDPLDIMDGGLDGPADRRVASGGDDGGLLFRVHEYLPDVFVPYFEAMVDTLLDVLIKANIITDVKRMRPKSGSDGDEPENVALARKAHTDASSQLSKTRSDLETRTNKLKDMSTKYGRQMEFKSLENKCVSKDMGEYTYEYCFFGRAKQIPNNGGGQISLGTFTNWNPRKDRESWQDEFWTQQIYARGQKCWNGPERSAIVDLVCDVDNALLDVFEAEKCIYSIKVSTPAVCFPPEQPPASSTGPASQEPTSDTITPQVHVKDEL